MKKRNQIIRKILASALAAAICVSLSGCRQSDVIQEVVNNIEAERTEQVAKNQTQDGQEDDQAYIDRSSEKGTDPGQDAENEEAIKRQEEQKQEDRKGEDPAAGDAKEQGTVASVQPGTTGAEGVSDNSEGAPAEGASGNDDAKTQSGGNGTQENTDADNTGSKSGEQSGGNGAGGSGDQKTDDNAGSNNGDTSGDDGEDPNADNSHAGDSAAPLSPDDENARQIQDDSGNDVYIPNKVSKVAAPGEAALIVQMLGGQNTLVATSDDFRGNELAMRVFADELSDDLVSVWDDADDNYMDEDEFRTLLNADPDCVVLFSENTFTEAQQAELTQNSIGVVLLPKLNTTANTKKAVRIAGQMLKNNQSSSVDAVALAEQYCSYMDNLIARVERHGNGYYSPDGVSYDIASGYDISFDTASASHGKYTVFIDDWSYEAYSHALTSNQRYLWYQDGMALSNATFTKSLMYHYLNVGGVYNTTTDWYQGYYISKEPVSILLGKTNSTDSAIYNPETGQFECEGYVLERYFCFERRGVKHHLGTEAFPAVIVKDRSLKALMDESKNSVKGMYRPAYRHGEDENTQLAYLVDDETFDGEPLDLIDDENVDYTFTDIWDDYSVYVNPTGVGNWTGQSIEGVLESIWASYIFFDEEYFTLSDVEDEVRDFYQTFYRHDLKADDLEDILMLDVN